MAQSDDPGMESFISELLAGAKPLPEDLNLHLEPENSPFEARGEWRICAYEVAVARALLEPMQFECRGNHCDEIACIACLPSFQPEWAVWVAGNRKTGFSVLLNEAEANIWYSAQLADEGPPPASKVKLYTCPLPSDRAIAICDIWKGILSQIKHPEKPRLGCDGVYYHFSYWRPPSSSLAGKIWLPGKKTVPGRLAALGHALGSYAQDEPNRDVFMTVIEDHLAWFSKNSYE